ncbi:MAG TPA: hypothetical protein VFP49_06320 [Nitrososphaeraceae archaeon]|nr:hypothetical protein [Nitrososphaeraceae archaeon]
MIERDQIRNVPLYNLTRGGYKGMLNDLDKLLDKKYPDVEYPCEWADEYNDPSYSSRDLTKLMRQLRLEHGESRGTRSRKQEAALARLMIKNRYCDKLPPTAKQEAARHKFISRNKQFNNRKDKSLTRAQFFELKGWSSKYKEPSINILMSKPKQKISSILKKSNGKDRGPLPEGRRQGNISFGKSKTKIIERLPEEYFDVDYAKKRKKRERDELIEAILANK